MSGWLWLPMVLAIGAVAFAVAYDAPRRQLQSRGSGLKPDQRLGLENEWRQTNFQIIGAGLLLAGALFALLQLRETREQVTLTEQTQATERLVTAVRQIGSRNETEQIGGIYSLRRIVKDGVDRHDDSYFEVLDQTLSGFIRQHSSRPANGQADAWSNGPLQAALNVLGNRERVLPAGRVDKSRRTRRLDLRNVSLRGADLRGLELTYVDFHDSDLSETKLAGADLTGANLSGAVSPPADQMALLAGRPQVYPQQRGPS